MKADKEAKCSDCVGALVAVNRLAVPAIIAIIIREAV